MKKSIIIIGGGEIGLNQIQIAKKTGFNVIVTDINPEAPGLQAADVPVNISATDIQGLTSYALENKEKYNLSAVYCGNDFGLLAVECLKQVLGLPHNSIETTLRCLNKKLMKNCWIHDGVSTPNGSVVKSYQESLIHSQDLNFPIIIKPFDSSGSRGISVINRVDELKSAFDLALKYTNSHEVLMEKYILGTHHDINAFFYKGKFIPCGIMDRYFTELPFCVPLHGYYPSILSSKIQRKIYQLTKDASISIGLKEGPVKADILLSDDGLFVYEISNRFHGDVSTSHLYNYSQSINPIKLFMETLYHEKVVYDDKILKPKRIGGWFVLQSKETGILKNLEWVKKVQNIECVKKTLIIKKIGDYIKTPENNTDIMGFVWITGHSRDEINKTYQHVLNEIKIN